MQEITIRTAKPGDEGLILSFIRALADYEHMTDDVVATEELLREWLFEKRTAEVVFAQTGGRDIAFALYFHNFSTFLGRGGIYLEDLFVLPEYRGQGIGTAIFKHLAKTALECGCGRLEWACLDWNSPSISFYLSLGAARMSEWTTYRLAGDSLEALARS